MTTKVVLVLDEMPNDCVECNLFAFEFCQAIRREIEHENIVQCKRPSWCPLKPLPSKKKVDKTLVFDGYDNIIQSSLIRGYNSYYDEITGETE